METLPSDVIFTFTESGEILVVSKTDVAIFRQVADLRITRGEAFSFRGFIILIFVLLGANEWVDPEFDINEELLVQF